MKNLYEIAAANGKVLCYQVARSEQEAVESAKIYGHRYARSARFIREN